MANTATLQKAPKSTIAGLGPVYQIRCNLSSTGNLTVITPAGSITLPSGDVVTTGSATDAFYIVGISKGKASSGTLTIKSGSTVLDEYDLAQNIWFPVNYCDFTSTLEGIAGDALVISQSSAVATNLTLWVVLADFKGVDC